MSMRGYFQPGNKFPSRRTPSFSRSKVNKTGETQRSFSQQFYKNKDPRTSKNTHIRKDPKNDESQTFSTQICSQDQVFMQDLDSFPFLQLSPIAFPTNSFICSFFTTLWENIPQIASFFSSSAQFSINVMEYRDPTNSIPFVSPLSYFKNLRFDPQKPRHNIVYGPQRIAQNLALLFPDGFLSHPQMISNKILSENLFAVEVHGVFMIVFDSSTKTVYGFNMSIFIGTPNGQDFEISNANLFIHKPVNLLQ